MPWERFKNMQAFKTLLRETSGAEIAETAAVLPVLFMVVLGIFFFGRAYNIYGTITQAAQQGARAAVVTDCATCTNTAPTAAQIATNYVGPALQASHLNTAAVTPGAPVACQCGSVACGTTVACDPAGTGATPSICVQQNVILTTTAGATQACGTAVSFQYPYNFNLPFESFTLNMKASSQMQAENQQ
jgi:Flp pilus assembly protein TadG